MRRKERFGFLKIPAVYRVLLVTGLFLSPGMNLAQDRGIITGTVRDARTGEPLYGANVLIKETVLGAAADVNGHFRVGNLPPGDYTVEATMIGYRKQLIAGVNVEAGRTVALEFFLESTVLRQPSLVVTASKRKQHIEDTAVSVDVIGAREIQQQNVIHLDEVIQKTAGLGITDGQIDLRGSTGFNWAAGSRVLLMVDGHPLINGDSGGINWDVIPVDQVERVEVVKGAGSALYGSNAMAGMVNIITREPSPVPVSQIKLTWGLYDKPAYENWIWTDRYITEGEFDPLTALGFQGFDFSHSRTLGPAGILLSLGRIQSSGYQQNGDYSRWHAMGKTRFHFSPQVSLTLTGNWALNDHGDFIQWLSQDRPLEVPVEEQGNRIRYEKTSLKTTFSHTVNQKWAYNIKANFYRCDWRNFFYDNDDYAVTDRMGTEFQIDYHLGKQFFTMGTEITAHHAESQIYGNQDTWDLSLYIEDEMKFSPLWTFTLGTRFDFHRVVNISEDQQISPRMGLVFRPAQGTSVRLSAGHGFRAPSIAEVFANTTVSGFRVVPNLDLKEAERAWSFEIGLRQALVIPVLTEEEGGSFFKNPFRWVAVHMAPSLVLDAAVFYSRYKNMIDVDLNPDLMAFQFFNLSRARNRGAEIRITASTPKNRLNLTAGYTYIDPVDLDTRKTLNYRSRHRVVTGVTVHLGPVTLGWDYRYASRMEEVVNIFAADERVPMHVMDARVLYGAGGFQIGLEVKNLRNYHYNLRQRYLEPVRHAVLTLRQTF
jgi:iron complex outermembrane receptor protein